jgi:hypothetical protein
MRAPPEINITYGFDPMAVRHFSVYVTGVSSPASLAGTASPVAWWHLVGAIAPPQWCPHLSLSGAIRVRSGFLSSAYPEH